MLLTRRHLFAAGAASLAAPAIARAQELPGVTATEIRIGNTMPYSGPASAYGVIGRSHQPYFRMINEQGGIAGRKINFITYDDDYSPPKTVEQVRRLVEQDKVAFLFNTLGTPTNSAIVRYVNQRKVPHLFLSTGADKWGNYQDTPWTIGWQPSYRTEAQIYTKHMLEQKPNAQARAAVPERRFRQGLCHRRARRAGSESSTASSAWLSHEVDRPDHRQPGRLPAGQRRRRAADRDHAEIRRADHPQGLRYRLAAGCIS